MNAAIQALEETLVDARIGYQNVYAGMVSNPPGSKPHRAFSLLAAERKQSIIELEEALAILKKS